MPGKKDAEDKPKEKRAAKKDPQGHDLDAPDAVPTADDYAPDRHANHSHLNP